jgi:TPR repeat protein
MFDNEFNTPFKKYSRARDRGDDGAAAAIAAPLAKAGDAIWQFVLAAHYKNGLGLEQDERAALVWFQKSADQGYPEAIFYLGVMYLVGDGVEQDEARGLRLFEESATLGYADAECTLGVFYGVGQTSKSDQELEGESPSTESSSVHLIRADQRFLPIDLERSFFWFRRAADRGLPDAQYAVGQAYQSGEGVETDLALAFQWFLKAAKQGVAEAQFEAANAYAEGLGTTRDRKRSERWMKLAAKQGHPEAIKLVKSIASSRKA